MEALSTNEANPGKLWGSLYPDRNEIDPVFAADSNAIPAKISVGWLQAISNVISPPIPLPQTTGFSPGQTADINSHTHSAYSDIFLNGFQLTGIDFAWPGKSGAIYLSKNENNPVAFFGEIHPNILKKIDIKTEALVCIEIYLDNIKETTKKLKDQKSLYQYSDYQKSERDFAFVIDKNFKVQELVNIISEIDKSLIRSVKVFDVYEGEKIPNNKKSIALNVTIQSSEKTLKEEDLEKINQIIISTVESKSGAKIRS